MTHFNLNIDSADRVAEALPLENEAQALSSLLHQYLTQHFPGATLNQDDAVVEVALGDQKYRLTVQQIPEAGQVSLSPREREIVALVAQGYPNKSIAYRLCISPWTVATYLNRIFAKLQVGTRSEMTAQVIKYGLI